MKAVYWSAILSWRPWNCFMLNPFHESSQTIITSKVSIRFQDIPILKNHIVIPPHALVKTHKHRYSYLENGSNICFHEPTKLASNKSLGQTLDEYLNLKDGHPTTKMMNFQDSLTLLNKLQKQLFGEIMLDQESNMIERWLNFGEKLRTIYDIYQYTLLKFKSVF